MTITEEYQVKKAALRRWYAERLAEMVTTMTLDEVSAKEGISREHVRQLVFMLNLDMPPSLRRRIGVTAQRAKDRLKLRDGHAERVFGCSWEEVNRLTGLTSIQSSRSHPLLKRYWHNRNVATRTKQVWELTLPEYAAIVGPHLGEIGRHRGAKVVALIDKRQPWRAGNIAVVTLAENSYRTAGFQKSHLMVKQRTMDKAKLAADMQASGKTVKEIAKALRRSTAMVSNYLRIAKEEITA